jgi:succinate dehydrogenase/fumarate reductase flavoprotein subunit
VEAVAEGEPAIFTARRGVVLATGGFAANGRMLSDYVGAELPPLGPEGRNNGDGVRLAQALGADLWHMNCVAAGFGYKVPDLPSAFMASIFGRSFFLVDGEGRRYLDELSIEHHAAANVMLVRDYRTGRMTRLPSYLIFGEQVRRSGRIITEEAGANRDVPWPEDNSDALERGWIKHGATLAELAARLGLPATSLEATAAEFEREPLEPPFYGIAVWPALFNTQGGPRRDEKARVLDVEGKPIPRLFSAGELGSIWAALYPGAGNVTEALVFGRIAGRSAAAS